MTQLTEDNYTLLKHRLEYFTPEMKHAIYAASQKGYFAHRSWVNCVLNAASKELLPEGHIFKKSGLAGQSAFAAYFGIPERVCGMFIVTWDSIYDYSYKTTRRLQKILLEIGLDTPAKEYRRITTTTTFKGVDSRFNDLVADNKLEEEIASPVSDLTSEVIEVNDYESV